MGNTVKLSIMIRLILGQQLAFGLTLINKRRDTLGFCYSGFTAASTINQYKNLNKEGSRFYSLVANEGNNVDEITWCLGGQG